MQIRETTIGQTRHHRRLKRGVGKTGHPPTEPAKTFQNCDEKQYMNKCWNNNLDIRTLSENVEKSFKIKWDNDPERRASNHCHQRDTDKQTKNARFLPVDFESELGIVFHTTQTPGDGGLYVEDGKSRCLLHRDRKKNRTIYLSLRYLLPTRKRFNSFSILAARAT